MSVRRLSQHPTEGRNIHQILISTGREPVVDQPLETQHWYVQLIDRHHQPIGPTLIEGHAAGRGENINALRRAAELDDRVRLVEVGRVAKFTLTTGSGAASVFRRCVQAASCYGPCLRTRDRGVRAVGALVVGNRPKQMHALVRA